MLRSAASLLCTILAAGTTGSAANEDPAALPAGATTQSTPAPATRPATAPTTQPTSQPHVPDENPPSEGSDLAGSDPKAIEIADEVMIALGGRKAWDETRYITWRFFGLTRHYWDKYTGDVRTELPDRVLQGGFIIVLHNINTRQGRAWRGGEPVDELELEQLLKGAYASFINDSYWLLMPYKLKDSGVTLKFKGEGMTADGGAADILTLTFRDVGITPQQKYDVYVRKDSRLVEQWAFYRQAEDEEPRMTGPWTGWKRYGRIMLADGRGIIRDVERKLTDIVVPESMPESVFTSPEPVRLAE